MMFLLFPLGMHSICQNLKLYNAKGRREREAKRWLISPELLWTRFLKKVKKAFRLQYLFRPPHQPKEANKTPKRVSVRSKKVHLL